MAITIIIFFFGLAVASGMIARKAWLLHHGQAVPESFEEADWTSLSIESIRTRLTELVRIGIHYVVLFALRIWITTSYFIRKCDRLIRRKLVRVLHKNGHRPIMPDAVPSSFLQDVHAHKTEMTENMTRETKE